MKHQRGGGEGGGVGLASLLFECSACHAGTGTGTPSSTSSGACMCMCEGVNCEGGFTSWLGSGLALPRPDPRPDPKPDPRPDPRPDQRPDQRLDQKPDQWPNQRPAVPYSTVHLSAASCCICCKRWPSAGRPKAHRALPCVSLLATATPSATATATASWSRAGPCSHMASPFRPHALTTPI